MATTISRTRIRPAKDEWGVYDPQQAGLAALFARLDTTDPKAAATPAQKLEARTQKIEAKIDAKVEAAVPARPTLRDAK